MSDSERRVSDGRQVSFGETVYDEEGNELGAVRGMDEHGFYVTTADGVIALSADHEADARTGHKELNWRCWECGEIGEIEEIPDRCPSCGAPREDIYYWQQD